MPLQKITLKSFLRPDNQYYLSDTCILEIASTCSTSSTGRLSPRRKYLTNTLFFQNLGFYELKLYGMDCCPLHSSQKILLAYIFVFGIDVLKIYASVTQIYFTRSNLPKITFDVFICASEICMEKWYWIYFFENLISVAQKNVFGSNFETTSGWSVSLIHSPLSFKMGIQDL